MIELSRLGFAEFGLLKEIDDGFCPDPQRSVVVVARDSSKIIGRIALVAPAHVEAIFIEERWRKGPLMKQLVQAIELEAKTEGIEKILCYAKDEEMADYIKRLGYIDTKVTVWEKRLNA